MIVVKGTNELIYIGQASSLSNRLAPSVHPIFDRKQHDVYILFEKSRKERRYMEGVFIQILKPPMNQRNGTMPSPSKALVTQYYRMIFD